MFNLGNIRNALGGQPSQPATYVADAAAGDLAVIDVRGHDEVAQTGKAKGAVHIPLMMLPTHADPRHPDHHPVFKSGKPIAVYCASGARSSMAAQILAQNGHTQVTNIGGLGHWVQAGGEIER